MAFYDELSALLIDVADRVDRWTGNANWTFEPNSPAAIEAANAEVRQDGLPWGDRPVRTVYQLVQMAAKYTIEMTRSVALLIRDERPAPPIESLTRTSLEAASVAWWLLEEGLTARRRYCRMQLLRRNNAFWLAKSIAQVGENRGVAGTETIAGIEAECVAMGLAPFGSGGSELEGERRQGYTDRVDDLITALGYHGAYSIYSGVAHAELSGLWRLVQQTSSAFPSQDPIYTPAPDPRAARSAADGVC